MTDFDPIEVEFLINSEEVKRDAEKVKADIKGVGKTAEDVNARISKQTGTVLKGAEEITRGTERIVGRSKVQFNTLGNSINQLTREIPAFAFSAQTGFLAISNNLPIFADEIARIKAQNDALTASGGKSIPVWKQVAKGFLSWNTALSLGVAVLTIYGPQLVDLVKNIFKTKDALDEAKLAQESLNKAYDSSSYQKAISNILELRSKVELAKDGILDKKDAVNAYNETLGEVAGEVDTLAEAEQGLIDKAPAYVEAMLFKAAALEAQKDVAKKLVENQKLIQENEDKFADVQDRINTEPVRVISQGGKTITNKDAEEALLNRIDAEKKKLEKTGAEIADDGQNIVQNFYKKAQEAANKAKLDLFPENDDKPKTSNILNKRKKLLDDIANLDREFAQKRLDDDAAELDALREKFDKVRGLINEFNADPKNATVKVDVTQLDPIQEKAELDLTFKQDTSQLKEELDNQKTLFREFEEFRTTFGEEKAKERYGAELAAFETYSALLKDKLRENQEAVDAVESGTATAPQSDRVELLRSELEEEARLQEEKFNELLAQLQSFEQQKQIIREKFDADYQKLILNKKFSEANIRKREFEKELDDLGEAYAKSLDEYRALIGGVEGLSREMAQRVVEDAKTMAEALLKAGTISEQTYREIQQKIKQLERDIQQEDENQYRNIADSAQQLSAMFGQVADEVRHTDEDLANAIETLEQMASIANDVANIFANIASGNIVGAVAGVISAVIKLFGASRRAKERARQRAEEMRSILDEQEDGERAINAQLREQNLLRAEGLELTLARLEATRETLELNRSQVDNDFNDLLRELQSLEGTELILESRFLNEREVEGFIQRYIERTGATRNQAIRALADSSGLFNLDTRGFSLAGLSFDELEALFIRGQLPERAAELFEQLRALREEGQDIEQLLEDLQRESQELFTGTTSNAIADSIIAGLRQGYSTFEDFAGDVEKLLQNAILNAIRYQALEQPIQELYEQFAEFAESNGELTAAEAQAFRDRYERIVNNALDQYDALDDILDLSALDDVQAQGLRGAIRRELTEETASELVGLFRSYHDIAARLLTASETYYEAERQNYSNTLNIIAINTLIESNTANAVVELRAVKSLLESIDTNTEQHFLLDQG